MAEKTKQEEFVTLRTFSQTWDFDYVFYGIGDLQLPFPITATKAGFFAASFILVNGLALIIPPLHSLPKFMLWAVLPYVLMKGATVLDIDGKPPHIWLVRQAIYLLAQPKRLCRFRRVEKPKSFSFNSIKPIKVVK